MAKIGPLVEVTRESPRPSDLPLHLETWRAEQFVVGDASGGALTVRFSVPSEREWYYAITTLRVESVAAMTKHLTVIVTDWEEVANGQLVNGIADPAVLSKAVGYLVNVDRPIYLGRVTPNAPGDFRVTFTTNTDLLNYWVFARGYMSEKPFVIPLTFSK